MSSAPKLLPSSSSKPPKSPDTAANWDPPNPTSNPSPNPARNMASPITPSPEDLVLSRAAHLTRPELLKHRSQRLKRLSRCYRDHYWAFMEDLKSQYREYYWKFGVSPFKQDLNKEGERVPANSNVEGSGENGNNHNVDGGSFDLKNYYHCLFVGCKLKAMALTSFCHLHILSDSKQKLYKACTYVIKSPLSKGSETCQPGLEGSRSYCFIIK